MFGYRMNFNDRKILTNKQMVKVKIFYWFLTLFFNKNCLKMLLNVNEKL